MAVAGVVLLGVFLVAYDAPALIREKRYKDLLVFLIFTVLGLTLSILLLLEVPIASLATLIGNTITLLSEIFKRLAGIFV